MLNIKFASKAPINRWAFLHLPQMQSPLPYAQLLCKREFFIQKAYPKLPYCLDFLAYLPHQENQHTHLPQIQLRYDVSALFLMPMGCCGPKIFVFVF